jgi:hypothetical protein
MAVYGVFLEFPFVSILGGLFFFDVTQIEHFYGMGSPAFLPQRACLSFRRGILGHGGTHCQWSIVGRRTCPVFINVWRLILFFLAITHYHL